VKIHFTGICGSQIGEINGVKGPDQYLPHLLGHEFFYFKPKSFKKIKVDWRAR
jgi:hypothetical protein